MSHKTPIPKITCPYPACCCADSLVVDTRTVGETVWRRRQCRKCRRRYTTTEQLIGKYSTLSSTHHNI